MARQRAKDLAEHARALMARDRQIEEMKTQLTMGGKAGESSQVSTDVIGNFQVAFCILPLFQSES